jgi:hypothetical protein
MPITKQHDDLMERAVYPAATPYPARGGERLVARSARRRMGRVEGEALEKLGHAVEYLIDSRMFLTHVPYTDAEEEAVQILMKMNRMVFESCPEVVSMRQRLRDRLVRLFHGKPADRRLA